MLQTSAGNQKTQRNNNHLNSRQMKELLQIQSELKAPKGQFNAYGKYKYRSCEDILEAVKPILKKNNCTLLLSDSLIYVGERYYIKATATLINAEGKSVSTEAYAREEETKKGMDASQITGASSSYARKYALNGLLCIDDNKDSDTTNTGDNTPAAPAKTSKEDNAEVEKAIAEINAAKSKEELITAIAKYKGNKSVINNLAFINAVNNNKYAKE